MRVYVRQNRIGQVKWYVGTVIGRRSYTRSTTGIQLFGQHDRKWNETKLLIKMSNGDHVTAWESETYIAEPPIKNHC